MTDKIKALKLEMQSKIAHARQQIDDIPTTVGMFSVKSANQTIHEASLRPDPIALYDCFWYEGEVSLLFADSNVGKSIFAVQIANQIAQDQKVLYFDFELSDKQFQLRYTSEQGIHHRFPPNLFRVEINPEYYQSDNFEQAMINDIEAAAIRTGAKILIIDNLSFVCITAEKPESAGSLMRKFITLKRTYGLSLLVLSHTPKRSLSSLITQNSMSGSKKLINFSDSAFAIGKSFQDNELRYLKQIKVRYGSFTHDDDNVVLCTIEKENSFLQFKTIGYATEREHLAEPSVNDKSELIATVHQLKQEGKTQRQIAQQLNLSIGAVNKYLKQ